MRWESVEPSDLEGFLRIFFREVISLTDEYNSSGRISKIPQLYYKPEVTHWQENPDGSINSAISYPIVVLEEFELRLNFPFFQRVISLSTYGELKQKISETMSEALARNYLERLSYSIGNQYLKEGNTDFVEQEIQKIMGDFAGNPIEWQGIIIAKGIVLEEDQYLINPQISIRKWRPSDIKDKIPIHSLIGRNSHLTPDLRTTIIECNIIAGEARKLKKFVDELVYPFLLYGVGSISFIEEDFQGKIFLRVLNESELEGGKHHTYINHPPFRVINYKIKSVDIPKIAQLITLILDFAETNSLQYSKNKNEILQLSLYRYNEALVYSPTIEATISSAIISLEALFLDGDVELSHRLSQRVATIFKVIGHVFPDQSINPVDIYRTVKLAYNTRSQYFHGNHIKERDQERSELLVKEILNIARISLLVFIQIGVIDNKEKSRFIQALDDALLDDEEFNNLSTCFRERITFVNINR